MYTAQQRESAPQSPAQAHSYANGGRQRSQSYTTVPQSPHHPHRSVPPSPTAQRIPPPPSPRERPASGYYDPTSDSRANNSAAPNGTPYQQPPSPMHMNHPNHRHRHSNSGDMGSRRPSMHDHHGPPPPLIYNPNGPHHPDPRGVPMNHHPNQSSPPSHAHPMQPAHDMRSPGTSYDPVRANGMHSHSSSRESLPLQHPGPMPPYTPGPPPPRRSNPMDLTNLMSENRGPPPPPAVPTPPSAKGPSMKASIKSNGSRAQPPIKQEAMDGAPPGMPLDRRTSQPIAPPRPPPRQKGPPGLSIRETERAWQEIQALDLSDPEEDVPNMQGPKEEYHVRNRKRTLEIESHEFYMRKRRRTDLLRKHFTNFNDAAESERQAYLESHETEVTDEVRLKEVEEDKERKKDQQRKRRREKAIADEQVKREETLQKLADDNIDEEERIRLQKDIQRMDKKIQDTQNRLQGITPSKDTFRYESPHHTTALGRREREVTMDNGNLMTSFYTNAAANNEEATPEFTGPRGGKRGGKGGAGGVRARKSKEQKLLEKENAAKGQALVDLGQDLPPLAPKEEERLRGYGDSMPVEREDSEPLSDAPATIFDIQPATGLTGLAKFESKGYNQIYEQISRELAKGVPKVVRIKNNSLDTKQSNARKTAQLAAKEARRWQARTNKSTKDVAARAKRAMREMLGFWKRNERDEREGRKVAERQELDKAKKAEAEREANRQKRKLNFLISQTELYSHFIGKKVKTDEIEKHGQDSDGVTPSQQTTTDNPNATKTVDLPDSVANVGKKVTNFEDLDFDAEDETALQEAAMANAQHAIQEAKNRAQAFDRGDDEGMDMETAQQNMDDGELNFQNPTSLQSMDITQPKMLDCQLKEYQIKGLNWLVNLYEQGINGILADEMGLGKTVQSISVMAYLAEVHDIWGPFLVIAPASTLHNWQQEITRFVPSIKVLPYWGSAKDRKILRKFWDRKHITYNKDSPFHVLVTSYQLVVQDTAYFQKVKWQYMILDEAQAIKSSQSSRWKSLLGFHCRNRLLLTGTPIQNNMQELWALLHFIMPSLFDSHDEFSEWFSKDIENHAQSNTKLNEDQLRRLHMILKPFMLRRVKKHVQKELCDKIEEDVFCDLTYRQRAYYTNLRNKISILDLIEKAAVGDDQDTATLMNLVMQFRKVCNHPDLFERASVWSPFSMSYFAETASFMREGYSLQVAYSVRSLIEFWLPKMLGEGHGRLNVAGPENPKTGWLKKALATDLSIWDERHVQQSQKKNGAFSWLRFVDRSAGDVAKTARQSMVERVIGLANEQSTATANYDLLDDDEKANALFTPAHSMLNIVKPNIIKQIPTIATDGVLANLMNISKATLDRNGYDVIESCYLPRASAPPATLVCASDRATMDHETALFNVPLRRALYPISTNTESALMQAKLPPSKFPVTNLLPTPASQRQRFTKILTPSMNRFVTDSGKLARLDQLLRQLKEGGHRVLLYFQMTRMIDLMEEYLTYRNYKYCRLDGSTKLEDRRDTVAAFQSSPDIFVFLLSTRAGGLGINLTSADTVIFYDSDWNPTIDSQAMDRAHRLGQTRQVTVYRLITRGTIEERIRKRALQKEEVQRVVISGQAGAGGSVVDFNNRSRETNRTKEMAMWLADDEQVEAIERREAEVIEAEAKTEASGGNKRKRKNAAAGGGAKRKEVSMDDMYHEGEGKFEDASHEASGAGTPMAGGGEVEGQPAAKEKKGGMSKKAKTVKQRLAVIDGEVG